MLFPVCALQNMLLISKHLKLWPKAAFYRFWRICSFATGRGSFERSHHRIKRSRRTGFYPGCYLPFPRSSCVFDFCRRNSTGAAFSSMVLRKKVTQGICACCAALHNKGTLARKLEATQMVMVVSMVSTSIFQNFRMILFSVL